MLLPIAESRQWKAVGRCTIPGSGPANSFIFPEKCLNSFVMPDVQTHYLVTPALSTTKGVGVVLSMSKHLRKS
jgi:hypothetical protein